MAMALGRAPGKLRASATAHIYLRIRHIVFNEVERDFLLRGGIWLLISLCRLIEMSLHTQGFMEGFAIIFQVGGDNGD